MPEHMELYLVRNLMALHRGCLSYRQPHWQVKEREQREGEIEGKEIREEGMRAGDVKIEEGGYEQLRKGLKG